MTGEFRSKLISASADFEITSALAEQFERLTDFLLETNKSVNLTAIKDEDEFITKHLVDSLSLLPHLTEKAYLIDVGSGAGFPALPLAIARPDLRVVAVESVGKKASFIKNAAQMLELRNISVVNARAEEIGVKPEYRERFDFATARAVARINVLCEYCSPFLKVGGKFLAMKSKLPDDELSEAKNAISTLCLEMGEVSPYTLGGLERNIVVIEKKAHTPSKFPRVSAQISKSPL